MRSSLLIGLVVVVLGVFFYQMSSWPIQADAVPAIIRTYKGPQGGWPAPHLSEDVSHRPLAPLPDVEYPANNPYSETKEDLGKKLFFDPRLSSSGTLACASCHDPDLGWSDGRRRSFGHARREGQRNSMTVLNAAYYDHLFWDGRAEDLEEQAMTAIAGPREMNQGLDLVGEGIRDLPDYPRLFQQSFGDSTINAQRIAKAIATFERGITSRRSDFDRFLQGNRDAMTDRQIYGLHVFRTTGQCMNCHNGALLSDDKFHNLGQSHLGRPSEDLGRFLVTGDTSDVGKFRTPSLRDVTYTGPYLHHGLIFNLREVIDMYDRGMPQVIPKKEAGNPLYPETSPLLEPLDLSEREIEALLDFLEAISTRPRRMSAPELPGMERNDA
ncbi:cytochrome-c peroxidase [Longibacter salinarum]|uniref:Methylamine utilization protein MauG n=1 Tax=Longibacter salinarum TaxID=1850348 RepID=A0A2A8D0I3_9BACT|nr:cytochrome c peroxidase [Longibacter salinarum]PEN14158.1 cytochrome-c peroxidase [Longibacter salinarum]